jgi:hypothetical protein
MASTTSPAFPNRRSQAATSSSRGRPSSKPLLPRRPSHPYVKPWTRRGWKSSRPVSGISDPLTARRSCRKGTSGWLEKGAMHGSKGPEVSGCVRARGRLYRRNDNDPGGYEIDGIQVIMLHHTKSSFCCDRLLQQSSYLLEEFQVLGRELRLFG